MQHTLQKCALRAKGVRLLMQPCSGANVSGSVHFLKKSFPGENYKTFRFFLINSLELSVILISVKSKQEM